MLETIDFFKVQYLQLLTENGHLKDKYFYQIDKSILLDIYYSIVKTRTFDRKAIALQRTGMLGTFPSSFGQEAIYVVIGKLMQKEDILCPYYRDQGAMMMRGVLAEEIFAYWGGDERGNNYKNQPHDFPINVPIGSQCLHAVGAAFAIRYRKQKRAVVTTIGDGGTSKGDFYEALNFASLHSLPIVFIINNNKWAISTPVKKQTNTSSLAQKAIAAGIDCIKVDGNDVFALHYAINNALTKAYNQDGPFLIEAETYRLHDHTTADDATRYNPKAELDVAINKEPLIRLSKYLGLTPEDKANMDSKAKHEIQHAADIFLKMKPQCRSDIKKYLYAEIKYD